MGCDIHLYVEYRKGYDAWDNFGLRFNPGRDYWLFSRLAGVRETEGHPCVFPVRGMPTDPAFQTRIENRLYVTDEVGEENSCTKQEAELWVSKGFSKYTDERRDVITHPDWHSHSHLTLFEFEKASRVLDTPEILSDEYVALHAAMKSLEKSGYQVRVVFWFDN